MGIHYKPSNQYPIEPVTHCHGLKRTSNNGKKRIEDCAKSEGLLLILQAVHSPKAELFKPWLEKVRTEN